MLCPFYVYVDGNNKQAVEFMSLEARSGERFEIGQVKLEDELFDWIIKRWPLTH